MNNDLISRKALLEELQVRKITEIFPDWGSENDVCREVRLNVRKYANAIRRAIESAPAVDAAMMQHGRWLPPMVGKYGCVCSVCIAQADNDFNYCPNCGARMDGGNSDENA